MSQAAAEGTTTPKSAATGRKPIERVGLFLDGVQILQVGVYAGQKEAEKKIWISDKREIEEKKSRAPRAPAAPKKAGEKGASAPPVEPQNFVHLKEGINEVVYPLSAEEWREFQAKQLEFHGKLGVHLRSFVDGRKVAAFVNTNMYYLHPTEVGENLTAYRLLHEQLYSGNLCGLGHWVRKKAFDPVAIQAVEEGLVMLQLPVLTRGHHISDAIGRGWKSAPVLPQQRSLFHEIFVGLIAPGISPEDLQNPLDLHLEEAVVGQKKLAGEQPLKPGFAFGSLIDALNAVKTGNVEGGTPAAPPKPEKKPKVAKAKKAPAAKKAASRGPAPKKPR